MYSDAARSRDAALSTPHTRARRDARDADARDARRAKARRATLDAMALGAAIATRADAVATARARGRTRANATETRWMRKGATTGTRRRDDGRRERAMTRAVTDDARGSATEELRTRLEGLETTLRAMLAPSEDGGAPRAADVRALRGEITALKSEIRAREAFGGVQGVVPKKMEVVMAPSASAAEGDEEAEMERELRRLEAERQSLMAFRALEEENRQLREKREKAAARKAIEQRELEARAAAEAESEARAAMEAKRAAKAEAAEEERRLAEAKAKEDAKAKKTAPKFVAKTPEEKAAALEKLKADTRARVRAQVDAKMAKIRADAEARAKARDPQKPACEPVVSEVVETPPAPVEFTEVEERATSGKDEASAALKELLMQEKKLRQEREVLEARLRAAEKAEKAFLLSKSTTKTSEMGTVQVEETDEDIIDVAVNTEAAAQAATAQAEAEAQAAAAQAEAEAQAAAAQAEAEAQAAAAQAEAEAQAATAQAEAEAQAAAAQAEAQAEAAAAQAKAEAAAAQAEAEAAAAQAEAEAAAAAEMEAKAKAVAEAEAKVKAAALAEAKLQALAAEELAKSQKNTVSTIELDEELRMEQELSAELQVAYDEAKELAAAIPMAAKDWEIATNEVSAKFSGISRHLDGSTPSDANLWSLEPAVPVVGMPVTVRYCPTNRVLHGQNTIVMHYGSNDWTGAEQVRMEKSTGADDTFIATVDVPATAAVMDFVFSDGGAIYDNADRADFHAPVRNASQKLEIARMSSVLQRFQEITTARHAKEKADKIKKDKRDKAKAEAKAKAQAVTLKQQEHVLFTEPGQLEAGKIMKLFYNPNNTSLKGSERVFIVGSWNRWSHEKTFKLPMTEVLVKGEKRMEVELNIPTDAYMMDFVFSNGNHEGAHYDNRNNMDYHIPVIGGKDEKGVAVVEKPLHVVSVSVEMAPIAKVGGLGDVVTSLGLAVQAEGHKVEVVLPKYDVLKYDLIEDLKEEEGFQWGGCYNHVFSGTVEGVKTYFIDPDNGMFKVGMIYGTDYLEIPLTDAERFGYFSRAALEWMLQSGRQPDIIHCHDWQTAPVAKVYWEDYHNYGLGNPRVVFTIHNLDFGQSLIREAMDYSQIGTTVSRSYAQEISGHDSISHQLQKFHGVVNGIDPDIWDPANDKCLPVSYEIDTVAEGKAACRAALCSRSNISNKSDVPLIGVVTRLTHQKGIHLIKHAIFKALERGCQVVLLGSAPDPNVQREFEDMANALKQNHFNDAALHLYFDEPLSHLIYAGSDMILVPSMFEPCGLSQLIAMRYGTVPVVRRTGGLADTVFDYDHDHAKAEWEGMTPNGFQFDGTEAHDIDYALNRAIDLFYNDIEKFHALQANCMSCDFSWNRPALDYIELYHAARK
jgi:starch synthase